MVRARAPPIQHLLCGVYKRGLPAFQGAQIHHGRFGASEGKSGAGAAGGSNRRKASPGDVTLGHAYADDAGVVSQSPEQLRKVVGVTIVVCAAFGLTVSEAKTEITFTHEGEAGIHRRIQRRGSKPGVQPIEGVHIPRGERQPQC